VSDLSCTKFYEEHLRPSHFFIRPHRLQDICKKLILGAFDPHGTVHLAQGVGAEFLVSCFWHQDKNFSPKSCRYPQDARSDVFNVLSAWTTSIFYWTDVMKIFYAMRSLAGASHGTHHMCSCGNENWRLNNRYNVPRCCMYKEYDSCMGYPSHCGIT